MKFFESFNHFQPQSGGAALPHRVPGIPRRSLRHRPHRPAGQTGHARPLRHVRTRRSAGGGRVGVESVVPELPEPTDERTGTVEDILHPGDHGRVSGPHPQGVLPRRNCKERIYHWITGRIQDFGLEYPDVQGLGGGYMLTKILKYSFLIVSVILVKNRFLGAYFFLLLITLKI